MVARKGLSVVKIAQRFRVGVVQICVEQGKPHRNLKTVMNLLQSSAARSCRVIVLPEMWLSDFAATDPAESSAVSKIALRQLAAHAQATGCTVIGSMLERKGPREFYNTCWAIGPRQRVAYRKIHLFRPLGEHRQFRSGQHLRTISVGPVTVGLSICYDLRFPELYRALARKGATVLVVPAAWPLERRDHWRLLLRARALENQAFVVGVNRSGPSPRGFRFAGSSAVYGPWGETLCELSVRRRGLETIDLDLSAISASRSNLPVWQDRKPRLYSEWLEGGKSRRRSTKKGSR